MDGTLWDSSAQVIEAWNLAMKQSGYQREDLTVNDMQSVMGKTMDAIAEILFPNWEGEKRAALLDSCCEVEQDYLREHGAILYPKLRSTMEQLIAAGYHLYIVSNCQTGYIETFLDHYRMWDLVEDLECYGSNRRQKGENIALIIERNQLEKAAYVGDTQGDYDATMAAASILDRPVTFIHAAYGFGTVAQDVKRIHSFSELAELTLT